MQRGWQCPGYGKNIRWSTKHERFGPLSLASRGEQSGKSPAQQAPQQPLYQDWRPPGSEELCIHVDSGLENFGTYPNRPLVPISSPHLPLSPISQCTVDNSIVLRDADAWTSPGALTTTSGDCDNNRTPAGTSTSRWPADTDDSINTKIALPNHSNAFPYSGNRKSFFDPQIFYTPTHIPTILVEHWFSDVCPMWNIFDSESNFNRQFASTSWSSSEPVFYAMQSMSAACLVDTLPAMMPVLSSLTARALAAIRHRVSFYESARHTTTPEFPTDLLFAIFAMGTSLHWKHGFELGSSLMDHAHCVIDCYRNRLPAMSPSERKHLAFFQKALICWEGILSAADTNFTPKSFAVRRAAYRSRIASSQLQMTSAQPQFGPMALSLGDAELHPWCGVSSDVLQKFGQVMTLCHNVQRRLSSVIEDDDDDLEAYCDLGLAHELASELLAMDFSNEPRRDVSESLEVQYLRTNDSDTPLSHLLDIAEAYRQACLLQLSLTFEELHISTTVNSSIDLLLPAQSDCIDTYVTTRAQTLVGLGLQLVDQLKKIPPESGSRCMQPLLYLCAASGLQFNALPQSKSYLEDGQIPTQGTAESSHDVAHTELLESSWLRDGLGNDPKTCNHLIQVSDEPLAHVSRGYNSDHVLTVSTLKVAQARSFVKKRLGMLQQLLPPRYTSTALRLAEAIWAEYDCNSDGGSPLYWSNVMVREKLQTFFG